MSSELELAAPAVSEFEAAELGRRLFGLRVTRAEALQGERDRNFKLTCGDDGGAFTLRVVHPAEPPDVSELQIRLLEHLAATDPSLPVPVVVPSCDGNGLAVWEGGDHPVRRVVCMTYLPGRPLHETAASPAQQIALGRALGRLDRALAEFSHRADARDLLWDAQRADRVRSLLSWVPDPEHRRLVERVLDRFAADVKPRLSALRTQVLHNDLNPHNVLVSAHCADDVVGIIDFGDSVRGPLIQDLATACAYHVGSPADPLGSAERIATGFQAELELGSDELELLPDMIAARLALAAVVSSWRARRHPENAAYILRNYRAVWQDLERLERVDDASFGPLLAARVIDARLGDGRE